MTSYSINLFSINELQFLESSLHILLVAMSGKPRASFQVVTNNLCLKRYGYNYRAGLLREESRMTRRYLKVSTVCSFRFS